MQPAQVRTVLMDAMRAENFYARPPERIRIEHVPHETSRWEVFRGHLLDASHTREEADFESWNVWLEPNDFASLGLSAPAPIISVKLQTAEPHLHIVRRLAVRGWETYESAPGVIQSRSAVQWRSELVGSIALNNPSTYPYGLPHAIATYLRLAFLGI